MSSRSGFRREGGSAVGAKWTGLAVTLVFSLVVFPCWAEEMSGKWRDAEAGIEIQAPAGWTWKTPPTDRVGLTHRRTLALLTPKPPHPSAFILGFAPRAGVAVQGLPGGISAAEQFQTQLSIPEFSRSPSFKLVEPPAAYVAGDTVWSKLVVEEGMRLRSGPVAEAASADQKQADLIAQTIIFQAVRQGELYTVECLASAGDAEELNQACRALVDGIVFFSD